MAIFILLVVLDIYNCFIEMNFVYGVARKITCNNYRQLLFRADFGIKARVAI